MSAGGWRRARCFSMQRSQRVCKSEESPRLCARRSIEGGRRTEMPAAGERLIGRRYKSAGGPPTGVALYEATGLDLAQHGDWLIQRVRNEDADFVVIDSLRTLAPHMAENDGDTVLPVMTSLRRVARETQ